MTAFRLVLTLMALVILGAGGLHLIAGLNADVLLGANLPDSVLRDPVLDSQNRFYGISFTLFGVLLLLAVRDLVRYAVMLRCLFAVFFAGGIARVVSLLIHGVPTLPVLLLLATELLLPPVLYVWLSKLEQRRS